jgi:hypothetical protein
MFTHSIQSFLLLIQVSSSLCCQFQKEFDEWRLAAKDFVIQREDFAPIITNRSTAKTIAMAEVPLQELMALSDNKL